MEKFAIKQLARGTHREQIIALLCEDYRMKWEDAEVFLLDLEIRQDPKQNLIIITSLGTVLIGSLFVVVYIIATIISKSTISLLWAILAFISGIGLFAIALTIYSRNENSAKERYRCPHCGSLANRTDHENKPFLPRYETSTYHTHKKLLSTQTVGETSSGEGWDIRAEYEITKICRRCHQVRSKKIVEEKRSYWRSSTSSEDRFSLLAVASQLTNNNPSPPPVEPSPPLEPPTPVQT